MVIWFRHTTPWIRLGHRALDRGLSTHSLPSLWDRHGALGYTESAPLVHCAAQIDGPSLGRLWHADQRSPSSGGSSVCHGSVVSHGRWTSGMQPLGDKRSIEWGMVIMDQRPTSVASRCIGHRSQRAYMKAEPFYAATGYASEEVCDILQRPIRRELCFPTDVTMPLTRAWPLWPALAVGQYIVSEGGPDQREVTS